MSVPVLNTKLLQVNSSPINRTLKDIWRWLLVIFLVALSYRFLYFLEVRHNQLFLNPVIDAEQHHAWAERISSGLILGSGPDDVFKPCLYPLLVGGIYNLCGPSITLIQWLQFIVGSFSVALTALLATSIMGKKVGITAGFVCALYAPFLFFEGQLLTPSISIFLNLILALMVLSPSPCWGRIGLLGGITAGFRPDVLISLALVCCHRLLGIARHEGKRRAFTKAAFLFSGFLAIAIPIMARNYALVGQWVFFSSNAGINFYTGNRSGADGLTAIPTGFAWEDAISTVPKEILHEPASTSRLWFSRGLHAITQDPIAWLKLLGKKAFAFFNGLEFRNNVGYNWFREDVALLRFPFIQYWPISALAILGMVLSLVERRKSHEKTLLFLWIIGFLMVGLTFFVTARFRLPAVPFMIILATWALSRLFKGGARSARRFAGAIFLVILLFCLTWPGWFDSAKGSNSRDYINSGNVFRKNRKPQKAIAAYRKAYSMNPHDPEGWFMAGTTYLNASQIDQAIAHLIKAANLCPTGVDILLNLGNAYFRKGNVREAERYYNAVIELNKSRNLYHKRASLAKANIGLWRSYRSQGKMVDARRQMKYAWNLDKRVAADYCLMNGLALRRCAAAFEEQAREEPWNWYPRANLGTAYFKMGQFEKAAAELKRSVGVKGSLPGVKFYLGLSLTKAGRKAEGIEVMEKLLTELPKSDLRTRVQTVLNSLK